MVFLRVPAGSARTLARSLLCFVEIGAANALVDHVFDAHGGVPLHVHSDLQEDGDDAGVLADGTMALGAHARVDQQLRDGIARGRRLLLLIGARQALDEVDGMVIRNVLQSVGNALDEIVLFDDCHNDLLKPLFDTRRFANPNYTVSVNSDM